MIDKKFRVFDEVGKKMYYPTDENDYMLLIGDSGYFSVQHHANFNIKTDKYKDLDILDSLYNKIILMQGMGHTDENGRDIYEADILAITTQDKQDILVVCRFGTIQRRMDTGFLCDITGFYFERSDGLNSLPIVKNYKGKHDLEMMQIVGNIYEHPNLLYTQSPVAK